MIRTNFSKRRSARRSRSSTGCASCWRRAYLAAAKTTKERNLRSVWIAQIKREISHERRHLNLTDTVEIEMTDDELLAALGE